MINREYSGGASLSRTSTACVPPSLAPGAGTTLPIHVGKGSSVSEETCCMAGAATGRQHRHHENEAEEQKRRTCPMGHSGPPGSHAEPVDDCMPARRFVYASRHPLQPHPAFSEPGVLVPSRTGESRARLPSRILPRLLGDAASTLGWRRRPSGTSALMHSTPGSVGPTGGMRSAGQDSLERLLVSRADRRGRDRAQARRRIMSKAEPPSTPDTPEPPAGGTPPTPPGGSPPSAPPPSPAYPPPPPTGYPPPPPGAYG